ncbi:unnamed protein product, partial [Umbelopsis sp. WA50703]
MSAPAQNFIGPLAQNVTNGMKGVEYSESGSDSGLASPEVPTVSTFLPRGAGSDPANALQVSISLAQADIVSLSSMVSSSNGTVDDLRNLRSKLSRRVGDLEMLSKALKLIQATADNTLAAAKLSNVVPRNLPLFQWENQVSVPGAPVFVDINTCIMNFTDVMRSHNLDLDANYLRVLPPLLAGTIRLWFQDFLTQFRELYQKDPSWLQFSTTMQERYGLNVQEERNRCARELNAIIMDEGESLESFIDRFNNLRRRAVDQVLPNSLLVERFLIAVPQKIREYIAFMMVNLPAYQREDIDVLSDLARRLYNSKLIDTNSKANGSSLTAPRAPKRAMVEIDHNDAVHRSSNKSRHASNLVRARSAVSPGTST